MMLVDGVSQNRFRKHLAIGEKSKVLIDKQFRECVAYLCSDVKDIDTGEIKRTPSGTAFFVSVNMDSVTLGYIVTAGHVIYKSRLHGQLFIRLNKINGGYEDFETDQDDWKIHDDTDLAIARVHGFTGFQYRYIQLELLATDEFVISNEVGEGDEVFFAGLFSEHPGAKRNQPIIRFGNISLMPYDKIHVEIIPDAMKRPVDAYLVEAKSWGGQSGSPAFVYFPSNRKLGAITAGQTKQFALLGVVQGHYEVNRDIKFIGDIQGGGQVPMNTGMAVVIPAQKIIDLLMREDVLEERKIIINTVLRNRPTPVPDNKAG